MNDLNSRLGKSYHAPHQGEVDYEMETPAFVYTRVGLVVAWLAVSAWFFWNAAARVEWSALLAAVTQ